MKYLTNLLIGGVLLAILAWNPAPLQTLELKTFDWLMAQQETVQDSMILIVDLDEEIVQAYGGYPLPRSLYATLIEKRKEQQESQYSCQTQIFEVQDKTLS